MSALGFYLSCVQGHQKAYSALSEEERKLYTSGLEKVLRASSIVRIWTRPLSFPTLVLGVSVLDAASTAQKLCSSAARFIEEFRFLRTYKVCAKLILKVSEASCSRSAFFRIATCSYSCHVAFRTAAKSVIFFCINQLSKFCKKIHRHKTRTAKTPHGHRSVLREATT